MHNRIKNPNWQEATSWLFTSVTEDFNSGRPRTNPASGQRELEPGTTDVQYDGFKFALRY